MSPGTIHGLPLKRRIGSKALWSRLLISNLNAVTRIRYLWSCALKARRFDQKSPNTRIRNSKSNLSEPACTISGSPSFAITPQNVKIRGNSNERQTNHLHWKWSALSPLLARIPEGVPFYCHRPYYSAVFSSPRTYCLLLPHYVYIYICFLPFFRNKRPSHLAVSRRRSILGFVLGFFFYQKSNPKTLNHFLSCRNWHSCVVSFPSGPLARHMNLMDLQRAAEQGRRGKMGTFPAGSVTTLRLDEALEWAAGALAKIQVVRPRV